jgi:hypothetical protein
MPSFSPRARRAANSGTSGTASAMAAGGGGIDLGRQLAGVRPGRCGSRAAAISCDVAAITTLSGRKPLRSGR